MTYTLYRLFLFLLVITVLEIVSGARLPRRSQTTKRQQGTFLSIEVGAGGLFQTYVCSSTTDEQQSDGISLHKRLDIQPDEMQDLWNQMCSMFAEMSALMEIETNRTCPPTAIPFTPPIPLQSASNVVPVMPNPIGVSPIVPLPPATVDAAGTPLRVAPGPVDTGEPFHPSFPDPFRPLPSSNGKPFREIIVSD